MTLSVAAGPPLPPRVATWRRSSSRSWAGIATSAQLDRRRWTAQPYTLQRCRREARRADSCRASPTPQAACPTTPRRRKIEHQVTKSAYEHLIIFTDAARTTQVWQWVARNRASPPPAASTTITHPSISRAMR